MKGFWYIDECQKDSTLYTDQLGRTDEQKVESGGYTY